MKKYISVLKRTKMFAGVREEEIALILSCLDARLYTYKKGEYVLRQGGHLSDITILVEGNLHIQRMIIGENAVFWDKSLQGKSLVRPM